MTKYEIKNIILSKWNVSKKSFWERKGIENYISERPYKIPPMLKKLIGIEDDDIYIVLSHELNTAAFKISIIIYC